METGGGQLIALETMEQVHFEERSPPHRDRYATLPILRVICESNTSVHAEPLQTVTLVVEGLGENGTVVETTEIKVHEVPGYKEGLGHSVGYRFGTAVKSIRVTGWWIEPRTA